MRNEAVIPGIAHRGVEKPVYDQRAGILVHFIFDRLAPDGHFNDDVDVMRRIDPDRDGVNAHGWLRSCEISTIVIRGFGPRIHRTFKDDEMLGIGERKRRRPSAGYGERKRRRASAGYARQ